MDSQMHVGNAPKPRRIIDMPYNVCKAHPKSSRTCQSKCITFQPLDDRFCTCKRYNPACNKCLKRYGKDKLCHRGKYTIDDRGEIHNPNKNIPEKKEYTTTIPVGEDTIIPVGEDTIIPASEDNKNIIAAREDDGKLTTNEDGNRLMTNCKDKKRMAFVKNNGKITPCMDDKIMISELNYKICTKVRTILIILSVFFLTLNW